MKFVIFVTRNCNLDCDYCYEKKITHNLNMDKSIANLVINFILDKIDCISSDENINILFHGGEPTLNFKTIKYIIEKLNLTTSKKISYHTTTNGTFNSKEIEFLGKNFSSVTFSIDGNEIMHGTNRKFKNKKNSYKLAINNAILYKSMSKMPRIRMTINKKNLEYAYEGIVDLIDKGFKYIVPSLDFNEDWNEDDLICFEKKLIDIKKQKILDDDLKISLLDVDCLNATKGDCFSLINDYVIDYNGDIYPCVLLNGDSNYRVGNVSNYKDLSKSENFMKIREIMKENMNSNCRECVRNEFCEGVRCKLINHFNTKCASIPHQNTCMIEHFRYSLLEKIL